MTPSNDILTTPQMPAGHRNSFPIFPRFPAPLKIYIIKGFDSCWLIIQSTLCSNTSLTNPSDIPIPVAWLFWLPTPSEWGDAFQDTPSLQLLQEVLYHTCILNS